MIRSHNQKSLGARVVPYVAIAPVAVLFAAFFAARCRDAAPRFFAALLA